MASTLRELESKIATDTGRVSFDAPLKLGIDGIMASDTVSAPAKALYADMQTVLNRLQDGVVTRSMLDEEAKRALGRAGGKRKVTEAERLEFRSTVQDAFDLALQALDREIPKAAPKVVPDKRPQSFAVKYDLRGNVRVSGPTFQPAVAPLTGLVENYIPDHETEPAILAFSFTGEATKSKFRDTFHNSHHRKGFPFIGCHGRRVAQVEGDNYLAVCPHYPWNKQGNVYVSATAVDSSGEYLGRTLTPYEKEIARQATLRILLDADLIGENIAKQAGYDTASVGAQAAQEQLYQMRRERPTPANGRG